jgi:CMP-N,N'-diacetyllegionaminic acid synthase
MYKTLGIIPARGGSKGLPQKNILEIAGKPLIWWTIRTAMSSSLLADFMISTEDEKIKMISEEAGGKVPFLRPAELADDNSSSSDVVLNCIQYYESQNIFFDSVALLEPTSPLRKKDDIDRALELFYDNYENADGIVSVGKIHLENPAGAKYVSYNRLFPVFNENKISRRQDYPDYYFPYGVLYIIKTSVLKKTRSFYTGNIMPYFIERWQNYELDDICDFHVIEAIMKMKISEGIL